jgi:alcohol dehydrogenase class IV
LVLDSEFHTDSIFSDVGTNPTFNSCLRAVEFCQGKKFNGVIAIGGGSVMDTAKVIKAYLCLGKSDIHELIEHKESYPKEISSIFIPTTHGTASEVTMWGTVWNMKEKKKYSISNISLYPTVAILDGNLTLSLPLDNSITTVMDALSHSWESIWNKNANPTSTDYAISAICSILKNAVELKKTPKKLEIRNNLLNASTTAGLAFSNTMTAAAHSMSYPLTIHYGIPHGIASSLTLLPLIEINGDRIKPAINKICKKNKLTFDELKQGINNIPQDVIPFSLNEWRVPKDALPLLAAESFTKNRMDNNISKLQIQDIIQIFSSIYN